MTRNLFLKIVFILLCMFNVGCVQYIARYDGPYEGKIIDAETKQPIDGVVILGVWYKEEPTVAGAVSSYYDAMEIVTDKNGDFKIPGKGLKILSNLGVMRVLIFKTGYEYIGLGTWEGLKESYTLSKKINWEGRKAIIPLKKLTIEERRYRGDPDYPPTEASKNKILLMLREINKDRTERGLKPIEIWGGERI